MIRRAFTVTVDETQFIHPFLYSLMIFSSIRISDAQAVGGVPPTSPFVPQNAATTQIVTTVVPIGPHPTHMICPSCHAEVDTRIRREPGLIAYVSGFVIALLGYVQTKPHRVIPVHS